MFEPGAFSLAQRLTNLGYKGVVFSAIGFLAGVVGTSLTNGLMVLRKKLDPNFTLVNEPPNIIYNAGTWGLHMGLSANLRYQVLGGTDRILVGVMPLTLFRFYQAGIRCLNNVVGGISFVTLARILGVQKSGASPPVQPAVLPEASKAASIASSSSGKAKASKPLKK